MNKLGQIPTSFDNLLILKPYFFRMESIISSTILKLEQYAFKFSYSTNFVDAFCDSGNMRTLVNKCVFKKYKEKTNPKLQDVYHNI